MSIVDYYESLTTDIRLYDPPLHLPARCRRRAALLVVARPVPAHRLARHIHLLDRGAVGVGGTTWRDRQVAVIDLAGVLDVRGLVAGAPAGEAAQGDVRLFQLLVLEFGEEGTQSGAASVEPFLKRIK